ncbi:hypothetical protein [Streptomyces kaempferi]|uniref:Uncharacterized protein n=1 Tax=Streptomyces kaempferi TaxID=333725 RepID=A0ABW3XTQ5_9ACTN
MHGANLYGLVAGVAGVKVTDIKPRAPRQRTATASKRLTKAAARKLFSALADR